MDRPPRAGTRGGVILVGNCFIVAHEGPRLVFAGIHRGRFTRSRPQAVRCGVVEHARHGRAAAAPGRHAGEPSSARLHGGHRRRASPTRGTPGTAEPSPRPRARITGSMTPGPVLILARGLSR